MSKTVVVILVFVFICSCNLSGGQELSGLLIYSGGGNEIRIIDLNKPDNDPRTVYRSSSGVATIHQISN